MSEWRPMKMADVMAEFYDGPHATPPPADDGPVYLGIKNLTDSGALDLSEVRHIAEEDFDRWTKRVTPQPNDIVFTYEATLHRYALIPDGFRGCLGRRLALIRPDRSVVNPRYLHLAMLGPEWRATVSERIISGSTVDRVPIITFPDFPIALPPLPIQERIAEILGAIDDLIENNRRRVEVSEEMARAIYREWFVHFRYPGHEDVPLVDSPLGPIPDGWHVKPLFDIAEVGFGFSFKSKRFADSGPFPVVRIRDVPKGTTRTFSDEEPGERYRVVDGDVLIGMDGDFHLGQWSGGIAWLNQRVARLRPRSGLSAHHLLLAVELPIREWNAAISGTTVAHLGKRHLEQVRVVIPEDSVLKHATMFFDDVWQQVVALTQAAHGLAHMRDLLLPKLVTGQIDVSHLDLDALTEVATA
jgi:type I restriction enzyme S subunit